MRIWWLKYSAAWTQPISMFSAQVPPPKVPDLWKSTTSQAGTFWGAQFYPELYLDPGSCGGNTSNTGPKSLPGESSCGGNGAIVFYRAAYCLKIFVSNLMNFASLILLLNWIESTLNWLKLNNDIIVLWTESTLNWLMRIMTLLSL